MGRPRYKVGDMIVLKSGLTRTAKADERCRIASILPNDHGHVQYRVQFAAENFDRRITEADIDSGQSLSRPLPETTAKTDGAEPWLKFSGIRTGR
ncbi:cold-shock protein [Rhizobium lentis]|uniref:cold-shock protein n=1 Tax=Rhizobium lentis TaxID=1138194 RepID=UPI001C83BC62|nr:cold-shock protein [Rhizobium lentis]MBX4998958.1 cold-shock protein [Rhizobium lentis]MBX5017868.1 cold-shock protein [Rhizobium lentis]